MTDKTTVFLTRKRKLAEIKVEENSSLDEASDDSSDMVNLYEVNSISNFNVQIKWS